MRVKKILFPTDFSASAEQALDEAIVFARHYGAELHMLHVTVLLQDDPHNPAFHFPEHGELYDRVRELTGSDMAKLLDRHVTEKLEIVQLQRRNSSAANGTLEYIDEVGVDLVVMGTAGRTGLRRALMGSVAGKVVQLAPCPVLTLRAHEPPRPVERIKKILAPIDFSLPSARALHVALGLAVDHGAELQLLHVIEDFSKFPNFYRPIVDNTSDELGKEADEQLRKLMREHKDVSFTVAHRRGKAADAIAAHADAEGSDLVVISTRGLTGLQRVLIGSTTERVVALANCPVLTVKDREHDEDASDADADADVDVDAEA